MNFQFCVRLVVVRSSSVVTLGRPVGSAVVWPEVVEGGATCAHAVQPIVERTSTPTTVAHFMSLLLDLARLPIRTTFEHGQLLPPDQALRAHVLHRHFCRLILM